MGENGIPTTGQTYNSVDQDQVHRLKSNNGIEFLPDFRHNAGSQVEMVPSSSSCTAFPSFGANGA
jgi:hypothetical protein